jgi:nucleoside permease NupC
VFLVGAISLPIVITIFLMMASTKEKITWREALGLILLYILFVYLQTLFK